MEMVRRWVPFNSRLLVPSRRKPRSIARWRCSIHSSSAVPLTALRRFSVKIPRALLRTGASLSANGEIPSHRDKRTRPSWNPVCRAPNGVNRRARRRNANVLTSRPWASYTTTTKERPSRVGCSPTAMPWPRSRQIIQMTLKRRSSTPWRSRLRRTPGTRPTQTGSRQEPFSRGCLYGNRPIRVWPTTSSMRMTCLRSQTGLSQRHGVTLKLLPMRLTRCTCRRTPSHAWDTGRSRLTATSQPRRLPGARAKRPKNSMRATTRPMPTCKPARTMRQAGSWRLCRKLPRASIRKRCWSAPAHRPPATSRSRPFRLDMLWSVRTGTRLRGS